MSDQDDPTLSGEITLLRRIPPWADRVKLFCRIIAIIGTVLFLLSLLVTLLVAYSEEKRILLSLKNVRQLPYKEHDNQVFEAARVILREPVYCVLNLINRFLVWPWFY
jgi:hypothetical protein